MSAPRPEYHPAELPAIADQLTALATPPVCAVCGIRADRHQWAQVECHELARHDYQEQP